MPIESDVSMSEPIINTGVNSVKDIEVILKWTRTELEQVLTAIVMLSFHDAASVDMPQASSSKISSFLRELDSVIAQATDLTGLSVNLLQTMRQHSQRIERFKISSVDKRCCATSCLNPVSAFVIYTGPAYKPRIFVLDPTASEDQKVYFCAAHHFVADRLFSLIHLRWNVLLNAQHRIKKQPMLMTELTPNSPVVTNLVTYYMYLMSDFSPSSKNYTRSSFECVLGSFYFCAHKWEMLRKVQL